MLTQQRHEIILELLREKGSITVTEVLWKMHEFIFRTRKRKGFALFTQKKPPASKANDFFCK